MDQPPAKDEIPYDAVAVFQEKSGGARGLNLPSIFEETRVLEKKMGLFIDYKCFS